MNRFGKITNRVCYNGISGRFCKSNVVSALDQEEHDVVKYALFMRIELSCWRGYDRLGVNVEYIHFIIPSANDIVLIIEFNLFFFCSSSAFNRSPLYIKVSLNQ